MNVLTRRTVFWTSVVVVGALLVLIPEFGLSDFWELTVASIYVFAVFGMSYNIVLGQIGLFSLSHALFFGLSGYLMTYMMSWGYSVIVSTIFSVAITAVVGFVVSLSSLRIRDLYFSLATLVLAQLCYEAASSNTFGWSGGENGRTLGHLPGWLNVNVGSNGTYFATLVVFAACLAFAWVLSRSSIGRVWHAIRENRVRAASLGINVARHNMIAFTLGSAIAGLAGVLDAIMIQVAVPDQFALTILVQVLLVVMIGGPGTVLGPVFGAIVVELGSAGLLQLGRTAWVAHLSTPVGRAVTDQNLVLGILYVLIALFFPAGIAGASRRWSVNGWSPRLRHPQSREDSPSAGDAFEPQPGELA